MLGKKGDENIPYEDEETPFKRVRCKMKWSDMKRSVAWKVKIRYRGRKRGRGVGLGQERVGERKEDKGKGEKIKKESENIKKSKYNGMWLKKASK